MSAAGVVTFFFLGTAIAGLVESMLEDEARPTFVFGLIATFAALMYWAGTRA